MIERETMSGSVRILKNHVENEGKIFVVNIGEVEKSRWTAVLSALWYYMEKGEKMTIIILTSQVMGKEISSFLDENGMNSNARLFKSLGAMEDTDFSEEILVEAGETGVFFKKRRSYIDGTVSAIVKELKQYFGDYR